VRKYGFLVILLALWVGTTIGFWHQERAEDRERYSNQCELIVTFGGDCPPYRESDTSFWAGFWENHQSEYAQLFVQGLLLIALANVFARKESENTKNDVKEALREMGLGS